MTLLCKESMHLDSHMTTSAGLSCEAFENAMVCEMQPNCSEMRLRCGGRGYRRCGAANCRRACVSRVGIRERHRAALLPIEGLKKSKEIGHRDHAPGSRDPCSEVLSQSVSTPDALSTLTRPSFQLLAKTQRAHVLLVAPPTPTLATYPANPHVPATPRGPSSR